MRRHAFILSTLAVVMLGVACTRSEPPDSTGKTRVAVFAITGMVTPNCPVLVKAAVGQMKGIKRVEADLQSKSARVEYDEAVTSPQKILEVIKDKTGFSATFAGS